MMTHAPEASAAQNERKSKASRIAAAVSALVLAAALFLLYLVNGGGAHSVRLADVCGIGLSFYLDGFRAVYVCLAAFSWMTSSLFSTDYFARSTHSVRYHTFSLLTLCSATGIFLSGDLFTLFIFFELLSLTSFVMVAHDEKPAALRAAETYLAASIIGGMTTLMGLLLLQSVTGTLEIGLLYRACALAGNRPGLYVSGALTFFGFAVKAGVFPLHFWLPKAHPAAPAPASALMSGILIKCGVFGVIIISCEIFRGSVGWGVAMLTVGSLTMLIGAVIAIFSVELKRTLACSSVSQIGLIFIGIAMICILGEHNAPAVRGTVLHMINHSFFKLVLFLAAGVVHMNLHTVSFNDIRGFGRGKPLFSLIFLIAAAGIAGIPLFSGYISKTLLHDSVTEGILLYAGTRGLANMLKAVEFLFIVTGGLTVSYMLKLAAVLFGKNKENNDPVPVKRYMSRTSAAALVVSAAVILILGVAPGLAESIADFGKGFMRGGTPEHSIHYFSRENLRGVVYSLLIGAAVYFLFIRAALIKKDAEGNSIYPDVWPRFLDIEGLIYRPFISGFVFTAVFFSRIAETLPDALTGLILKTLLRPFRKSRFPGKFFSGYYRFVDSEKSEQSVRPAVRSGFSVSLLLFGAGLCAMLCYLVFIALKKIR